MPKIVKATFRDKSFSYIRGFINSGDADLGERDEAKLYPTWMAPVVIRNAMNNLSYENPGVVVSEEEA